VAVQNRTFELVREMVRRQSRRRPLILLVEDLHWIERTSEACFASLLEVSLDAPVVLIFTYRPNYDADWLAGDAVLKIPLQALEPDDSLQVVRANTRGAQLSATMERTILAKAEGVPFFLEELTRAMLESQELGDDVEVPATIEGVITSRIDRLQEPTKQLLMTAAVLGRVFHRSLIREIWHRAERIDPLLNELVRMEFVVSQPGGGELAYMFRHALIQEVAYGCLLTKVRREIHALAGAALERLYAEHLDDVCDRLAHHYAHTQKSDKAVEYLYRFGEKAAHAYSHLEAISAFEQALTKAHPLEPADLRDHWILKIALKLARSFTFLGRFPDIVELLTQHGKRVERVANDRLGGQYYFWLGHTYSYRGQQALAAENAQRAMTLASRCGDPATAGRAAYVLERSSFWLGSFPEAIHYSKQAVTLLEEAGERWWLGQARWMSGWAYGAMGSFDEALHAEEQTHLIGQEIRDPRLPCYAAWTKAVMLACRGDYEEAVASGRMGIERSPDPLNTGVAWGFTGFACLEAGDLDEAAMLLEIGAEQMEKMGFRPLFGWFSTWGGEACLGRGDLAQGRELALRGKEVCEAAHNPWGVGLAQRALGRCALAEDDLNGAQEHLEGALSTFTAIRSRYFAARVHVELGKIARQRDDREAATEHLKIAQGVFGELRCTPHLQKVRRMARAYGVSLDDGSPGGRPTLSSNSR
jgi:tetratricopeptide (TPR) repeat protein